MLRSTQHANQTFDNTHNLFIHQKAWVLLRDSRLLFYYLFKNQCSAYFYQPGFCFHLFWVSVRIRGCNGKR